jgi:hypothetical protein
MTYFLDEFKEYDNSIKAIPKGSIIGIYGKYYKLSIWYVYAHYNNNISIVKLDDNYNLAANPEMLMVSTEDLNYYIVEWDAYYINISDEYISNIYKFKQPIFKVRYGDIISISDYKDNYSLFFVMNFDPVTNTYLILNLNEIKNKYQSINIGLCNYYILSRKELRSNIINKSRELSKKFITNENETLNYIDKNIYIKTKNNFLLEQSSCKNLYQIQYGLLYDNLELIKNDIGEYGNYQTENEYNNEEWKQIFTKTVLQSIHYKNISNMDNEIDDYKDSKSCNKINDVIDKSNCVNLSEMSCGFLNGRLDTIKSDLEEYDNKFNNDENYINTFTKENVEKQNNNDTNKDNIIFSNNDYPVIKVYSKYDNVEVSDDEENKYVSTFEKEHDLMKFSYSSEEYEYNCNYNFKFNDYDSYDNNNQYFKKYLDSYQNSDHYNQDDNQDDNKYYSGEHSDSKDSYEDTETSYCSDMYIYNNKYNTDYIYEECNQLSESSESSESLIYNVNNNFQDSYEPSELFLESNYESDKDVYIKKFNNYKMKYDCDYINSLFENYYNTNDVSALDTIQMYTEDEDYSEMPKLIPIQDYIDNCCKEYITDTNVLSNEIIIQIPENTEKQIENTQTSEITDNINKVDEIDEEYVDINISDVEPYTNNNESCMIM